MSGYALRGRDAELGSISGVLHASVRGGSGGLVVLTGDPGIGKSALLHEAAKAALGLGFRVGTGKADEIDQIAPGAPLLVALRSGPVPLLSSALFTSLAPLYDKPVWLVERIGAILEDLATTTPLMVAVDDIQWADRLTQFALRVLPARLSASPIVWLVTSRVPLDVVAAELSAPDQPISVTRVTVPPLPSVDLAALAADRLGREPSPQIRSVLAATGGNPFWAVQLISRLQRSGNTDLTAAMRADLWETTHQRVQSLSPEAQWLVHAASVWGRTLDLDVADRLNGISSRRLLRAAREAERSGMLTWSEGGVQFQHDLLREAVYADLPGSLREDLHRSCGRYLLTAEPSALAAAPHFRAIAQMGDFETVHVLLSAAEESVDAVPDQAAELAAEALALVPSDDKRWADTGEAVLDLLVRLSRKSDTVALADRLLVAVRDVERHARIQVAACQALWEATDGREIERRTEATLVLTGLPPEQSTRLRALHALAATRTASAHYAADEATEALRDGRRLGDRLTQEIALHALTEAARDQGQHQLVYDRFVEMRAISPTAHLAEEIRSLQHLDRYDEADALLATIRHELQDDVDSVSPATLFAQVWQDHNLARFGAAEQDALALLRSAQSIGNFAYEMNARIILTALAIYRGDITQARISLNPIEHRPETRDEFQVARLRATQAWLASEEGNYTESISIARPLLTRAGDGRNSWPWSPPWMRAFAGIGMAGGDKELVRLAVDLAETGARRNPEVASLQGVALQTRGVVERDIPTLLRAVEVLRGSPRPLLLANALTDLGLAELAANLSIAAQGHLDQAWALFDELGVVPRARKIAALRGVSVARRHGPPVSRRQRPTEGLGALTRTELRVAELVVAGHSSRSAAAELVVSPNTVNTHLRSIFQKLEVRSRVQLANVLRDSRR